MTMQQSSKYLARMFFALWWTVFCLSNAQASEVITFFHNDISGSPVVATNASGNVVWKESYRPYGDRLKKPTASSANSL